MKTQAHEGMNTPNQKADAPTSSAAPSTNNESGAARWHWHYRTLLALRERLTRAHADHARQAISPIDTSSNDAADTSQEQTDRDILWAELSAEDSQLAEIDAALDRIRSGSYGRCEMTGEPIPAARLRALPWTRFCRSAAQHLEKKSNSDS